MQNRLKRSATDQAKNPGQACERLAPRAASTWLRTQRATGSSRSERLAAHAASDRLRATHFSQSGSETSTQTLFAISHNASSIGKAASSFFQTLVATTKSFLWTQTS